MSRLSSLVAVGIAIAVVVVIGYAGKFLGIAILKENIANEAGKVIGALAVVALLIERSVAVVNSILTLEEQAEAKKLQVAGEWAEAEAKFTEIDVRNERVRLTVGMIAGLFVSLIGIRTLGSLTNPPPTHWSFAAVDIVLTAGLLAGGSNGLALLVEALKKPLQVSIARAKTLLIQQGKLAEQSNRDIVRGAS